MNHKGKRGHGSMHVLSVLLAVLMCTAMAVEVRAESLQEMAPVGTTVPAVETVVEETSATEAPLEPEVPMVELQEVKEAFLALLPEETKEENADIIHADEWNNAFCREDILTAIQMNIQAIQNEQELESKREALSRKIQDNETLTDEQRTYYLASMEEIKEELGGYSSKELFYSLSNLTAEHVSTEATEEYLSQVEEQNASLDGLSRLLDTMVLWEESDEQVAFIADYLARESGKQTGEYAVEVRCSELMQRAQQLRTCVNAYFTLNSEEQQKLAVEIQTFSEDVDTFFASITLDSSKNLTALQEQTEQVARKLILVYIALGVGVLGVLIGVIAAVLVLTKRSEEPVLDVSILASRETTEKLSEQNQILKREIKMQDEKLHEQIRLQNEKIDALTAEIKRISLVPTPTPMPAPTPMPVPVPPEPIAQKVCYLKLSYVQYAPNSSFLVKSDSESEYVLYDDNTVEFINTKSGAMNQLSGWSSEGVLYLFNPVLNGQEIDSNKCQQYSGYYQAISTIRRAKVKQINGGNYILAEKGSVGMKGL